MTKSVKKRTVKKHWSEKLRSIGKYAEKACAPARRWAKGLPTYAAAWAACTRPDWLEWLLYHAGTVGQFNEARRVSNTFRLIQNIDFLGYCFRNCATLRNRKDLCDKIRKAVKRPPLK